MVTLSSFMSAVITSRGTMDPYPNAKLIHAKHLELNQDEFVSSIAND